MLEAVSNVGVAVEIGHHLAEHREHLNDETEIVIKDPEEDLERIGPSKSTVLAIEYEVNGITKEEERIEYGLEQQVFDHVTVRVLVHARSTEDVQANEIEYEADDTESLFNMSQIELIEHIAVVLCVISGVKVEMM